MDILTEFSSPISCQRSPRSKMVEPLFSEIVLKAKFYSLKLRTWIYALSNRSVGARPIKSGCLWVPGQKDRLGGRRWRSDSASGRALGCFSVERQSVVQSAVVGIILPQRSQLSITGGSILAPVRTRKMERIYPLNEVGG